MTVNMCKNKYHLRTSAESCGLKTHLVDLDDSITLEPNGSLTDYNSRSLQ